MQFVKVNGAVKLAQRAPEPGAAKADASLRLPVCQACPGGFYRGTLADGLNVRCAAPAGCVGCGDMHTTINLETGMCPWHFW